MFSVLEFCWTPYMCFILQTRQQACFGFIFRFPYCIYQESRLITADQKKDWNSQDGAVILEQPGWSSQTGATQIEESDWSSQDGAVRLEQPGWSSRTGAARMEQSDWRSQDGAVRLEQPEWSRVDPRIRSPFCIDWVF